MIKIIIYLLILISTNLFAQINSDELLKLANIMEGQYSSREQSLLDSNYFEITLKMKKIWNNSKDTMWLYVEQAVADLQDNPYRQRVYRLRQIDATTFESEILTLKNPKKYIGAWKLDNPLSEINPDSLMCKEGCAVILKKIGEAKYSGSTIDKKCSNDFKNAKYATSIVTIFSEGLISWDRGYDDKDIRIWGAEKSGYFFKKIK